MAKQECITLFPEVETVTRKMSNEQFGILIRAVIAYRMRGEVYSGEDIAVDIAFQFLANQQDRAEAAKADKSKAANAKWAKQAGKENMQTDADTMQIDAGIMQSYAHAMQNDADAMQSDAPILSNPILSSPIQSYPIQSKESKADEPPAPAKAARKSYGEFGWVKLTDEEYRRLLNDLGEAEVKRCIAYIDESAQSTRNKNKWRDWNLVVRRCAKDGWGLDNHTRYSRQKVPMGATGVLGEAELEAIQRVLKEG